MVSLLALLLAQLRLVLTLAPLLTLVVSLLALLLALPLACVLALCVPFSQPCLCAVLRCLRLSLLACCAFRLLSVAFVFRFTFCLSSRCLAATRLALC